MERRLLFILGIGGYLLLLLITILHHQAPLFDEPLFVRNLYLFDAEGLSRKFLLDMNDQAPGPLYQLIHYPLYFITHWQTPGIRLVNTVFLGIITWMLTRIIRNLYQLPLSDTWLAALNIIAVPMIWQVSGMALTEIPPVLFSLLSAWCFITAVQSSPRNNSKSILFAIFAGISCGIAIIGRSPFLIMIPAAAAILIDSPKSRMRWMVFLVFSVCALAIALPLFIVWKGLMPPKQAVIATGGFSIWHGILSFAYGAMVTIIIAPRWFIFNKRILLSCGVTYILLLILNLMVLDYTFAPMSEVLGRILPAAVSDIYPYLISPLLGTIAFYFVGCSLYRLWENRENPVFCFLLCCGMLMLATSFAVTHLFSSRYVAQAAPFLLLVLVPYDRINYAKLFRFAVGMCIGLLSLETYFLFR
ncbi:glycosyltransferase family 39 protein [Chitinophaga sp. Cy-1792]|uniref:glycosyltransferase family 39 protein n=1 Tax=Chitinophaga sp. Cy-1792 TaxID=2608339 RepID=UPI001421138F|nr:glycosyltransferase family 39 protein [Chitinophaga sp. Cy-1792]NIG56315.1 hypothetical protein [Chitinophaga sp. Cy-1792]